MSLSNTNRPFDVIERMTTRRKSTQTETTVVYTRVSTGDQADSGAGLLAQETAIREECKRRGWTLAGIFTDAASGKSMKGRPALAEALAAVTTGQAQGLLVSKIDRLSRSLHDFAGLLAASQREGWTLCALDTGIDMATPGGEFMAGVMASAAQWERRIIGVRTREGLAAKRAQGVRLGRRVGLPAELRDRIAAERAAGATLAAIADSLNSDGIATAQRGHAWYPSTVRAVLASIERDAERAAIGGRPRAHLDHRPPRWPYRSDRGRAHRAGLLRVVLVVGRTGDRSPPMALPASGQLRGPGR